MKLSSSTLTYLLASTAFAEASIDRRKLFLDQQEAAERVSKIVETANARVQDSEDLHGVAVPLGYAVLGTSVGATQQLTVAMRLPGVDEDQHLIIDTGSSSIGFCNKSLAEAADISKTSYGQCNAYGRKFECPDRTSSNTVMYVADIYNGTVSVWDTQTGQEIAEMEDVFFGIMEYEQIYACVQGLDGIIGIAYWALNKVVELPSPDYNVLDLWKETCETNDPYNQAGKCEISDLPNTTLTPALQQSLEASVESGYNSVDAFGLYCDYAATSGSQHAAFNSNQPSEIIPNLGIYYGGNIAMNNEFYNNGTPQVASVPVCTKKPGLWFVLTLNFIRVPGMNITVPVDVCDPCKSMCITDSGASWIELPLPQDQCDGLYNMAANSTGVDKLKKLGSLELDLDGANGDTVTLSLPLLWLAEQLAIGRIQCNGSTGRFILGLPIFQYYYLVYDQDMSSVTFVDLQLSNETEEFIDGPDLGGVAGSPWDPSSGSTVQSVRASPEDPSSGSTVQSAVVMLLLGATTLLGIWA